MVSAPAPVIDAPVRSLHGVRYGELAAWLARDGVAEAHARTLWRALHRELTADLGAHADFSPPLRRWIARELGDAGRACLTLPEVVSAVESRDSQARKFLLRMADGREIETVVMGYPGRFTACLSTQAGCAMGCVFCATGQQGFGRHLAPEEIVTQALHGQRVLKANGETGLRNLVLMGMGEPLHNYDAVMQALEIITDTRGLNLGPSRISISTVGVVPGIVRLADENRPYNLAVSLHGATEEARAALVPVSRRWPLAELIDACRYYGAKTGRRIFFGWTLIAGKNDSPAHAHQIAELLRGLDAHLNLIPLNATDGYAGEATSGAAADVFQSIIQAAGFPCTIRQRRGIDVAAGCGQLKAAVSRRATDRTGRRASATGEAGAD